MRAKILAPTVIAIASAIVVACWAWALAPGFRQTTFLVAATVTILVTAILYLIMQSLAEKDALWEWKKFRSSLRVLAGLAIFVALGALVDEQIPRGRGGEPIPTARRFAILAASLSFVLFSASFVIIRDTKKNA